MKKTPKKRKYTRGVEIPIRLPLPVIDAYYEIGKMAGVTMTDAMKVALVMELKRGNELRVGVK